MGAAFLVGMDVLIPCVAQPGPVPGEQLVTVEIDGSAIEGFVRKENLHEANGQTFIRGKILRVEGDLVHVRLAGSFFTKAAGIASLSRSWAARHIQTGVHASA